MLEQNEFRYGVEIELEKPDDFLKIKETLQRIGIPSLQRNQKTLFQSCHILHKKGRYYIVHFKEMFALDGKKTTLSDEDLARRDLIALKIDQWGLAKLTEKERETFDGVDFSDIKLKIIPHKQKNEWVLIEKYSVGKKGTAPAGD